MTVKRSIRLVIAVMLALTVSAACSKSRGASIVQLLATPKDFVGDRVIVNGYARSAGGTLRLYLTKEDALMWNNASAIPVATVSVDGSRVDTDRCHDAYVMLIGEFGIVEPLLLYGIVEIESLTRYELSDDALIGEEDCIP